MSGTLTLKQLRYVEAAGRLGSIAAAAEALSISQSSITAAIDALEAELGFDLFARVPAKGIQPTPPGLESIRLISGFLTEFRDFEADLYAIGGTNTGVIRLACFATAAATFLPPAIERFQRENPGVTFELLEGNMDTVVDFLNDGRADVAFTYEEVIGQNHRFEAMVDLPHYALLSLQDPLSQRRSVTLRELATRPMISLELPRTRSYYADIFKRARQAVNVVHRSSSVEMIRTLVASGFGFTVLNAKPAAYVDGKGGYRAVPITDELGPRPFGMVTLSKVTPTRAVLGFRDHCRALRAEGLFEKMAVRLRPGTDTSPKI